jgi:hypothetical protein
MNSFALAFASTRAHRRRPCLRGVLRARAHARRSRGVMGPEPRAASPGPSRKRPGSAAPEVPSIDGLRGASRCRGDRHLCRGDRHLPPGPRDLRFRRIDRGPAPFSSPGSVRRLDVAAGPEESARSCGRPEVGTHGSEPQRPHRYLRTGRSAARCAAELPRMKIARSTHLCNRKITRPTAGFSPQDSPQVLPRGWGVFRHLSTACPRVATWEGDY